MKIELREYVNSAPLCFYEGVVLDGELLTSTIETFKSVALQQGLGRFTLYIEYTSNKLNS